MTAASKPLILYGVPFSQPVRATMWLMIYKRLAFDMVLINPGSKGETGSRHPNYLAKNPGGTIPCIEEPENGFTLGEAHAIMCYLSRKHRWHDVYPDDLQTRARIDWYLHFHHRNVREASAGLVAPKIRKDMDIPETRQRAAEQTLRAALEVLDRGWLKDSPYLVGNQPTIADFAAYVEIGQLHPRFTNVLEFDDFPNVARWLERMTQVEGHDAVHVVLAEIGDISREAPDMTTIKNANKRALQTLKATLAAF